jgi:hypothetical protein
MKKIVAAAGIAVALLAGSAGIASAQSPRVNDGRADVIRTKAQIKECVEKIGAVFGLKPQTTTKHDPRPPRDTSRAHNPR